MIHWVCFILCVLKISIIKALVPEDELFPFGINAGDAIVQSGDDAFAGPIELQRPFLFFNATHTSLYVNNNGAISFVDGVSQYSPICGALPAQLSMIAPFWADVNNDQGFGGTVYYRESNDRRLKEKASKEIHGAFPEMWSTNVNSLFISTWHEVPFYGALRICRYSNTTVPRNTFQLILATDGTHSFAMTYYTKITWTTGTASGGDCSGLGGNPAKAGFDVGDGRTFYTIPGSCTSDMIKISDTSNVGSPGKWIFRVDDALVSAACDSEKYSKQKLQITPSFITVFGQVPISMTGPCFNESFEGSCVFHDGQKSMHVPALIGIRDQVPTAMCVVPYLYTLGRIDVDLNLHFGDVKQNYTGYIYSTNMEEDVRVDIDPISDDRISLNITWDPEMFPGNQSLELALLEYDLKDEGWIEKGIFGWDIQNTGLSRVIMPDQNISTFGVFTLRIPKTHRRFKRGATFELTKKLWKLSAPARVMRSVYKTYKDLSGESCDEWYKSDPGVQMDADILHCPPILDQALQDERYMSLPTPPEWLPESWRIHYFIQRTPSSSGAGQQCAYRDGNLLMGPPLGGHVNRFAPNHAKNAFGYIVHDVLPYYACCVARFWTDDCQKFYEKRPSDAGVDYARPRSARASGDPHLITFDLASYTFNGVGEFWMIKNTQPDQFQMQARMEQYKDPNGTLTLASVFTAFVMREQGRKIQIQLSSIGMDILLNGDHIDLGTDSNEKLIPTEKATIAVSPDRTQIRVSFNSGFSFALMKAENSLTLVSMADEKHKGEISGLLGAYDGDAENDLRTPNGTFVPLNSSLEKIHHDFGVAWMIEERESFFVYGKDKTYSTYRNDRFAPNFDQPDPQTMPEEIVEMCHGQFECLYDFATTKSVALANQTRIIAQSFNETLESLSRQIPMCSLIKSPHHGYVNATNFFVNETATFGCYQGYALRGNGEIRCNEQMQWSGSVPICASTGAGGRGPRIGPVVIVIMQLLIAIMLIN